MPISRQARRIWRGASLAFALVGCPTCGESSDASHAISPAAGESCIAMVEGTERCSGCDDGSACFTQLVCSPNPDGTPGCSRRDIAVSEPEDGRCHRVCSTSSDCAAGHTCVTTSFFACTDFNGGVAGRKICCVSPDCRDE